LLKLFPVERGYNIMKLRIFWASVVIEECNVMVKTDEVTLNTDELTL